MRSVTCARPAPVQPDWPPLTPFTADDLEDPLAPAHGLANPHKPKPNNSPGPGRQAGTTFMPVLSPRVGAPGGKATSYLASPAPSSLFISRPQEHGHAGLPKAQLPSTIERLANKLRDGGIATKFHSRGRAQWLAAVPTSSPKAHFDGPPPHLPFSARSQHHDPAPGAFDCPRRDAPNFRLSRKTARTNKIIKGV